MKEVFKSILNIIPKDKKGVKFIIWFFIIIVLLIIVLYPIIDANILYYNRTKKRLDIMKEIISIDIDEIKADVRLEEEYNSILNDMEIQRNNSINNIFIKETSFKKNVAKFISCAWLFAIAGISIMVSKDKKTGKRNWISGVFCIILSGILGYIGMKIPTLINCWVNIIIYQIIIFYFAYSISKVEGK